MLKGESRPAGKQGAAKHLPALFLSLSILLGGIIVLFYYIDVVSESTVLEISESNNIELQTEIIASDLESVASDLMVLTKMLATMPAFTELYSDNNEQTRAIEDIVSHFIVFSEEKHIYDQIRFLNEAGMEVIRVNYNNGNPVIVKPDKLQSKANRYYFKSAITLEADELFVSPFDLNIEKSEIEIPIKPMIRLATPMVDSQNRNQGILLLNYMGEKLLTSLKMAAANNTGEMMLLNPEGYWLLNNKAENNWGFMYESKKDVSFRHEFPDAWKRISNAEEGQFKNKNGLFTFATTYPFLKGQSRSGGSTSSLNRSDIAYSWKVVSRVEPAILAKATRDIAMKLLILYVAMIGLLMIGVLILDRPLIHSEALPADKMSPLFLFVIVAVSIFSAESFVMLILSFLKITSPWLEALIDGSLLVLLISPFLYIFLFRPLILHISERRHAEEAFRESEERFRRLSEASFEGVIIHDKGKIIEANQAYADTFGYQISELKGKNTFDLVTNESAQIMQEKIRSGYDKYYEVVGLRKDGSTFPAEFVAKNAFYEGQEVRIGAVRDITKRKLEEDELRRAKEQAEDATKLKDKFVSLVSHDLKNPINGMIGFLQLLSNEIDSVVSEKGRQMITLTKKNLYKMNDLINELLNISRLKTGKIKPCLKFIDAHKLVMKSITQLEKMAGDKGITLSNNIPNNSRFYADPALLFEVIQNLLTNAIKFCHAGGRITLFIPEDDKCSIAIKDTGVGIEPERVEKIFNYEEQTSTVGTGGETGTGLGLPLSMDIVKAHNGRIHIESIIDEGTTFYIHLPYTKPKILLLETSPAVSNEIKTILAGLDLEIFSVENGRQGMALIKSNLPHLILLNLNITETNGLEFITFLRSNDNYRDIPVIVLISNGGHQMRELALALGADDFIHNSTSSEELIPRVMKHFQ